MKKQITIRPVRRFLTAIAMLLCISVSGFANVVPIADDILTISGGTPSADNPDVYVIDMGEFTPNQTYSITIDRPKAMQADYPVGVEYYFHYPYNYFSTEKNYEGVLKFAVGETQKTLEFTALDVVPQESAFNVYLFLGEGNRTKAQCDVVKLTFTNSKPFTPVIGADNTDNIMSVEVNLAAEMGPYVLVTVGSEYFGHINVLENTQAVMSRWYIDHEAHAATISDTLYAVKQNVYLKPEQPAGETVSALEFLYKITNDAIITDFRQRTGDYVSDPGAYFTRHTDSILNLKMAANQDFYESYTSIEDTNFGVGEAVLVASNGFYSMEVAPRFGVPTSDAKSYDKGETIIVSIPVLNSKLMQKLYPNNKWLEHIDISFDGGETFLNHAYITFDGERGIITAIGQAVNKTDVPINAVVELRYRKIKTEASEDYYWFLSQYYPYGVNAVFEVTADEAEFQTVTDIDFTIPENGIVNINTPNVALLAKVIPTSATCKTGTWTSSDPSVAEISANGVLTPKAYGKTIITYVSDEKAYRNDKGLEANDEILIRSFDIYVVGDYPEWYVIDLDGNYHMCYYEDGIVFVSHNLKNNAWEINGEIAVEVIHSDADTYGSITDAFEATSYMTDELGSLTYQIPFDDKTFPKDPTALEAFSADSIWAEPYRLILSMPLKQEIGDTIMTCVLRDTFDVHLHLPRDPVVKLIKDAKSEMLSGENFSMQYEVKYLNKHKGTTKFGFQIERTFQQNSSAYEGATNEYTTETFRCVNDPNSDYAQMITDKGGEWSLATDAPDWIQITDMGHYYNAIVTIERTLPVPTGSARSEYEYFFSANEPYEQFTFSIGVENITGFVGTHPIFGTVLYRTNKSYFGEKSVKAYTLDFDLIEKRIQYSSNYLPTTLMSNWNGDAVDSEKIKAVVDSLNNQKLLGHINPARYISHRRTFQTYLQKNDVFGDLVVGITKHNSNDTLYSVVNTFGVTIPSDGDYDLILSYPKLGKKRSYTYRGDSICANRLYVLDFERESYSDVNDTLFISYMNGDSLMVDEQIVFPPKERNRWFEPNYSHYIYEPSGIIDQISYRTGANRLSAGAITPLHAFSALPDRTGIDTEDLYYSKGLYVNKCELYAPKIGVILVDEETGEKITTARINYIPRRARTEMDTTRIEVATWDDLLATIQREKWEENPEIVYGTSCMVYNQATGEYEDYGPHYQSYTTSSDRTISDYRAGLLSPVFQSRISSLGGVIDEYSADCGEPGTVTEATGDVFLVPANRPKLNREKMELAMEIIADGYYPRTTTYSDVEGDYKMSVYCRSNQDLRFEHFRNTAEYQDANLVYTAGVGYQYQITVPLKKQTQAQRQSDVRLWTERPYDIKLSGWSGYLFQSQFPLVVHYNNYLWGAKNHLERWSDYIFKKDEKSLNTLSANSIASYSRYADLENAVLNVTLPVEEDWDINAIYLTDGETQMSPLHYSVLSAEAGYTGFEKKYVNLSYRLNDMIDYQELKYLDIVYDDVVLSELPGLFNDEVDPGVYESEITQGIKDNLVINPAQFDVSQFSKGADLGTTQKAMDKMGTLDISLPDPIPFEFQTRTEGNRYFLRGILSHNFIDDIPLVGQANMGMSAYQDITENTEKFEAAFGEIKSQVGMFKPKRGTKRFSSISAFAGIRGYMEGYGEYDPYTGNFEYGLNEGGIMLELSASTYVKTSFVVGSLGVGLDALASATLGFSKPSEQDLALAVNKAKFDMWLETEMSMDVYVDLTAGLDLGVCGAKAGISGSAGFTNKNKMVVKPYLPNNNFSAGGFFEVRASLHLWAYAYFLFWSWSDEWEILDTSKRWYYPNNSTNPYVRNRSGELRTMESAYKRNALTLPTGIITDVAANAYPLYFDNGKSLLFSNLKSLTDQNDDCLSVYSNGNINDLFANSELPAYSFDVATSPNGVSVVAFEQMIERIQPMAENVSQESYIKTQSANMDVFASIKTGNDWQTTQLSDKGVDISGRKTDMQPKTAVSTDGTRAAVVWKSGSTTVTDLGVQTKGNLLLSYFDGTTWGDPINIMSAEKIADYELAVNGESVVIAATRVENEETGKIRLIHVVPSGTGTETETSSSTGNTIRHIETGHEGRKPQITQAGDNYFVSFMGRVAIDDTTTVNDMYLLGVSLQGEPIDSLSGFAGMTNKVSFDYKLVADSDASSFEDLAILYPAAKIVSDEGDVETSLYASKFGKENGQYFASEPMKMLTVSDADDLLIISYDGYKEGNNLKAAISIANTSHGAIVVEESAEFENKLLCVSESFNAGEMKPGQSLNIEFNLLNAGYKPLSSYSISIDGSEAETIPSTLLPGDMQTAKSIYRMTDGSNGTAPYSITATFADGSSKVTTGTLDLTSYNLKVNLVSLKSTDSKNTALVEVVNNSVTPLTENHQVTVGVYSDIFGEDLVEGTTLKTLSASELYGETESGLMGAKIAAAAFDIPVVKDVTSVYAIAKVKKVNLLRSSNGVTEESEDVDQANKSYASIQLFPVRKNDNPTKLPAMKEPKESKEKEILIHPNPVESILNIKCNQDKFDKLEVLDFSGRLLMKEDDFSGKSLNVTGLKSGMYLLKLTYGEETVVLKFNKK